MCELFAMSSSRAEDVSFSLDEFSRHGGLTDQHKDGWGIAYYEDNDARIIKEASSANESAYLHFIKHQGIRSKIIVSHIRLATQGEVSVRNTQPFSRELAGKRHIFAHNGDLSPFEEITTSQGNRFNPIGNTDSELAFCYLMNKLTDIWNVETQPNLAERYAIISAFAVQMRHYGIANFIYSDSDYIFIHSHKRKAPKDGKPFSPGLHILYRVCPLEPAGKSIDGLQLKYLQPQQVILVASVPLSDENWQALDEGELRVLRNGEFISASS